MQALCFAINFHELIHCDRSMQQPDGQFWQISKGLGCVKKMTQNYHQPFLLISAPLLTVQQITAAYNSIFLMRFLLLQKI